MHYLVVLILFFANLVYSMEVGTVSNRSKQLSRLLFDAVADHTKMDLAMAKKLLSQFKPEDVLYGDIGDTVPVLHHLLDLQRLTANPHQKAELVDIMLLCLKVGADPSKPSRSDPPLLFKAIVLKELNLAKAVADASSSGVVSLLTGHCQWSSLFFSNLYAIPSETVPLVKLLLHADTIVCSKGQAAVGGVEGIKKLLAGAVLGKPTVRAVDLNLHSPTFSAIVSNLGLGGGEAEISPGGGRINLIDLIRSLDELAGAVHQSVLNAALQDRTAALRLVEVITGSNSELRQDLVWPMGRNALHYLALSGGAQMIYQLRDFLVQLESMAADSAAATVGADGDNSQLTSDAAEVCAAMMRRALAATDDRGHSPISYAAMRFSAASPASEALLALSAQVKLDHAAVLASAVALGVLMPAAQLSSEAEASQETPLADGGWKVVNTASVFGFAPSHGNNAPDARLLEVTGLSELPSNREFFLNYLNRGMPVVFRRPGFTNSGAPAPDAVEGPHSRGASAKVLREVFRKDKFVSEYGPITVPAATIPYAGTFGVKQVLTTMKEVANSQKNSTAAGEVPLYTFCTPSAQWATKLLADAPVPRCIRRGADNSEELGQLADSGVGAVDTEHDSWAFEIQFYLGSAGTGAPAHFHGHAINSLAYGEKEWLLYPPVHAFYSTTPAQHLFVNGAGAGAVEAGAPVRVTQRAGDVLFVPALWGHATLNTQQSIGVAHEFSVESFCME